MENFDEYIRQGKPNKAERAKVWKTAIGLQQVDGLRPSGYLIEVARSLSDLPLFCCGKAGFGQFSRFFSSNS
ncbi:MAG: hypothetical protein RBQ99_01080 [Trichlorobacter sp.]|nr:hypothetical protein [Trichlorobacter sp.]